MQDTTRLFDLLMPDEPLLLDIDALYQRFAHLTDHRHRRGIRYSLPRILMIAVLVKLAGEDTVDAIAEWARLRATELTACFAARIARCRTRPPGTVIPRQTVDPHNLTRAVREVLTLSRAEVPDRGSILLVLDGKTLRGTIPRGSTRGTHLLAAYLPHEGVVLAQEERTITVSSLLKEHSDWPYLEQVFQLTYETTDLATGKIRTAVRYGITSQPPEVTDPQQLLAQVRGEWGIETGLHGRRDVTLGEDAAHLRQGQEPHVLATLNNTVVGLVLKHGYANLAQARRVMDYLLNKCLHQLCFSWLP